MGRGLLGQRATVKVLAWQLVTSGSPKAVSSLSISLSVASLGELLVGAAKKMLASDRMEGLETVERETCAVKVPVGDKVEQGHHG